MGFTCGIVGLPNVGKSTLFNALTSAKAAAANFPFCTIEPNTGAVPVPDHRLDVLAQLSRSEKVIPATVTFVDIAGLIRGAAKGEGLGNQFLGHIRAVDAIIHVVRCFDDEDVVHVEGNTDPVRDLDTVVTELVYADYESVEKARAKFERLAKSGNKEAINTVDALTDLCDHLGGGKTALTWAKPSGAPQAVDDVFGHLLSAKPSLVVANVSEEHCAVSPSPEVTGPIGELVRYSAGTGTDVVVISARIESEIAELPPQERPAYLAALGLEAPGLHRLAQAGYSL